MVGFESTNKDEKIPSVENFPGVGELTVGGTVAGGDTTRILFTALALADNPVVNQYLLANKLKLTDRMTGTQIFPREGMALPGGEVFSSSDDTNEG